MAFLNIHELFHSFIAIHFFFPLGCLISRLTAPQVERERLNTGGQTSLFCLYGDLNVNGDRAYKVVTMLLAGLCP